MDTFTIVIFLAVTVVLAVAIIALAIWVAVLSSRMKKLVDSTYTEAMQPEAYHAAPAQSVQPRVPTPAVTQPAPAYSQTTVRQQPSSRAMSQQGYGSPARSQSPNLVSIDDIEYVTNHDGSAFFDSYQEQEYGAQSTGFGRRKPTIPYGKAKGPARRYDSYTESAMDSDYDPDSIDFSRVEGYKNFRP